jgi:hypothetical protein
MAKRTWIPVSRSNTADQLYQSISYANILVCNTFSQKSFRKNIFCNLYAVIHKSQYGINNCCKSQ